MQSGQLVRMKKVDEKYRTWFGLLTVPVGELGTITDPAPGQTCVKVAWPQIAGAVWTRRIDVEGVDEEITPSP